MTGNRIFIFQDVRDELETRQGKVYYRMDDVHSLIKILRDADSRLSKLCQKVAKVQRQCKALSSPVGPWFQETFTTGSLEEGALWAKCFQLHNVVRILEADFMSPIGEIENPGMKLLPVDHSPGFFTLTTNDLMQCMNFDARNSYQEWKIDPNNQNENNSTCQSSVLEYIKSLLFTSETKSKAFELIADKVFQPNEPSKVEVTFKTDGPSALTEIKIKSAEQILVEVQLDTVPCIRLLSWPQQLEYEQWINRKRKWPNPEFVSEVQRLVYIVAKAPRKAVNKPDESNIWRLSFSKAEMVLTSLYSEYQRDIYFLFKIMFYANIKRIEIDNKTMPSYFCKTTMLWMMEEEGDRFGEEGLEEAIKMLFNQLNRFLKDRYLPNFFYPSVNLLESYPEELVVVCTYMIEELIEKPVHYVPSLSTINSECRFLETLEERLTDLQADFLTDAVSSMIAMNDTNGSDAFELYWNLIQNAGN